MSKKKKLFVLDTNVCIHDHQSLLKFEEHDICIPLTVIHELDKHKTSAGSVGYHARKTLNFLKEFNGSLMKGVSLGEDLGNIFVHALNENELDEEIKKNLPLEKNDNKIIATAHQLSKKYENKYNEIVLVTKDGGVQILSEVAGVQSHDYTHDSVRIDGLRTGIKIIDNVDPAFIRTLSNKRFIVKEELDTPILEHLGQFNESYILNGSDGKSTCIACFGKNPWDKVLENSLYIVKKDKLGSTKIMPKNDEQIFYWNHLINPDIKLVTVNGIAGTGKTLLATLAGISQLFGNRKNYKQIHAYRPIIPVGREVGYLPGGLKDKLAPWVQPIFDNIEYIISKTTSNEYKNAIKTLEEKDQLVVEAITHVRGRSLMNRFIIVDEAQNMTPHEVKTLITRAGEGTKIVLVGDVMQVDHPYLNESTNGLSYCIEKFTQRNYEHYAHISLKNGERSELSAIGAEIL